MQVKEVARKVKELVDGCLALPLAAVLTILFLLRPEQMNKFLDSIDQEEQLKYLASKEFRRKFEGRE